MHSKFLILLVLILNFILTSCTPFVIGAGAATIAVVSRQEKTVGTIVDDKALWIKIKQALSNKKLGKGISVSISEGRVLITGKAEDSMKRIQIARLIWEQEGTRELMNELIVEEKESSFAKSAWITSQIKIALLMKSSIKSFNYNVETYDGVVHLLGIAQNKEEMKKVYSIARKTKGVRQIVSYVRMKNSPMRRM